MDPVFAKLNLTDENSIVVLGAPVSFERVLATLKGVRVMRTAPSTGTIPIALAFATTQAQVDAAVRQVSPRAADDIKLWFAYPKQTSTRFTCEFNRDTGWDALGAAGFEPVRQVALDEDWSAIRFRRAEHIPQMRRDPSWTRTEIGREKAEASRVAEPASAAAPKEKAAPKRKAAPKKQAPARKKAAPKKKAVAKKKPVTKSKAKAKAPTRRPAKKK